ncbi:hypothetical protein LPB140_01665 [Sphingorhabdus lutea]|uniref:PTS EIIA type-2 domain-containing protein n=1 Tax=Sphingorhabdus lutea TaxID=1913578 RepID=A0A1L3J9E7_9SPHN|nr:PTS sugar transporter subunit IIA [Sphingorhabdus lutea]APG61749.1 hypothetical protein LPB140_01665 [Sphingorhabdus lutea]
MLTNLTELTSESVFFDPKIESKDAALLFISECAAREYGLDSTIIADALIERERLGPTGFGGGTAIPHCRSDKITRPCGIFLSLAKAIDYDAVDDLPVDLIFCLISPADDGGAHLRALAEISRMFRNDNNLARLRGAANKDALYAMLNVAEEKDVA